MTIIEHPSPNHSARALRRGQRVDTVLLHHTGPGTTKGVLHWLSLPKGATVAIPRPGGRPRLEAHKYPTSAHYVVGPEGDVYRLVSEGRAAWHAGRGKLPWETGEPYDFNHRSIGIELVNPGDGVTPFTEAQYAALAWLVPDIVRRLGGTPCVVAGQKPTNPAFVREAAADAVFILGHRDVAHPPGRKTDPADNFDWGRVRQPLAGRVA